MAYGKAIELFLVNGTAESLITAEFSKMKEITDSVMKIAELAAAIEPLTDQTLLDQEATKAIDGFAALSHFKSGKEISCVFEFEDGQYPSKTPDTVRHARHARHCLAN